MKPIVVSTRIIDSLYFVAYTPCGQWWQGMRHTEDVKIIADRAMDHADKCPDCLAR